MEVFTRHGDATALRGPDLLRVKGFLDVPGCRGPVVVQIVQHLAHSPVEPRAGRTATARAVSSSSHATSPSRVRDLLESVQALTTGSMT